MHADSSVWVHVSSSAACAGGAVDSAQRRPTNATTIAPTTPRTARWPVDFGVINATDPFPRLPGSLGPHHPRATP
ncbi:hypothetical protein GCM10022242_24890 [Nocardioides panacisoli]|uniref:Uncharacterized protein n=1 Tax=Nocardioides panacisoli TaxID=627624 RepID=A0ABP7IMY8_9ACTN